MPSKLAFFDPVIKCMTSCCHSCMYHELLGRGYELKSIKKNLITLAIAIITAYFEDIVLKGEWVLVSKPNFFYISNYDIYQRWVGVKHRCHNFKYS